MNGQNPAVLYTAAAVLHVMCGVSCIFMHMLLRCVANFVCTRLFAGVPRSAVPGRRPTREKYLGCGDERAPCLGEHLARGCS